MAKLAVTLQLIVAVAVIKEIRSKCTHSRHGVQLTSNLVSEGRRAACPGKTVVYTCTVPDTGVLQWAIESFNTFVSNTIILTVQWDDVGTVEVEEGGLITANVTNAIPHNVVLGEITSTLTLQAHERFNNKTIWCGNGDIYETDFPCIVNSYGVAPSVPESLVYKVISHSDSTFLVALEWKKPESDGGLIVANYTIVLLSSYSSQRFITVHTKQYMTLLYNHMHTVQVTATNCRGQSPPTDISSIYEADCGLPDDLTVNASDHVLSTHEGSKYTFLCSENSQVVLECTRNGTWSQTPSNIQCSHLHYLDSPSSCKTPVLPPYSHIDTNNSVIGSVVFYQCNDEYEPTGPMVSICLAGEWTPNINSLICIKQVDCGVPAPPELGSVYYINTRIGSRAVISCGDGFILAGEQVNYTTMCSINGSWLPDLSNQRCTSTDRRFSVPEKNESGFIVYTVIGMSVFVISIPLGVLLGCVCAKHIFREKIPSQPLQHTYEEIERIKQPRSACIHIVDNDAYSVP